MDKNKLLDAVERREKTIIIRRILKYGVFILVFGAIYTFSEFKNYDRVKFSHELSGVVGSITTSKTETTFIVKLENDKVVKILKMKGESFNKGESVKILREELESGRMQYSFVLQNTSL